MIWGICVHDDKIRVYNIEMQNSHMSDAHAKKSQLYGGRILGDQREDYQEVKHVYQIIFLDDIDPDDPCLIDSCLY